MQISAELYEFVIKVVDDRVREIKVTREDFNALKQVVEELAQAQKKTEERLGRVEAAVEELAQAQKRTEEELCSLVREHAKTREMVAGLSDTVGYGLENQAYKALRRLLERDFDLKIKDRLARRYIVYKDGKEDEVNVYGWGMKDGKKILILGESEVKLSRKKLTRFLKRADRIKHYEGAKECLLLAITHMTHPKIEEYASQKGIKVYYSYEF